MGRRVKILLFLMFMLMTAIVFAACNTDLTSNSDPTLTPEVHITPSPTPAVDSRLDGYTTVPILNVKYPARNTNNSWISDPIMYITTHEQFCQLMENSDISSTKKNNLLSFYNEEYFIDNFILLVQFFHSSGSDRIHDFVGVVLMDNKLYPVVENGVKEIGSADIQYTIISVGLNKKYMVYDLAKTLTINKYHEENGSFKPINTP